MRTAPKTIARPGGWIKRRSSCAQLFMEFRVESVERMLDRAARSTHKAQLLRINLQIDIYRRAGVELAHRLGVALGALVLSIDFVVHVG